MLYQPTRFMEAMDSDTARNARLVIDRLWMLEVAITFAVLGDFVFHPQDKCWIYAPGWQKTANMADAYNSYFANRRASK